MNAHLSIILIFALALVLLCVSSAFHLNLHKNVLITKSSKLSKVSPSLSMQSSNGPPQLDDKTRIKIETIIKSNKVVLFMKGNKLFPQW